jgi:hypothetical protein
MKNTGSIPVSAPELALRNMDAAWRREPMFANLKPTEVAPGL